MHTYERVPQPDPLPEDYFAIGAHPFRAPGDVVEWARRDLTIGGVTWAQVWHLDDDGTFRCFYRGSSLDSLRRWADDPSDLHRSRRDGLRTTGCADHWLIVDSRPRRHHDGPTVDGGDVEAFLQLRPHVEAMGVELVDVMVFGDQCRWWSLHELTTGSTTWPPPLGPAA